LKKVNPQQKHEDGGEKRNFPLDFKGGGVSNKKRKKYGGVMEGLKQNRKGWPIVMCSAFKK